MKTGRAIIAGAIIIAATGAATAWAIQPRYSLTNVGNGTSIRLNRASGDMIGCERLACAPIVMGDKVVEDRWWNEAQLVQPTSGNAARQ